LELLINEEKRLTTSVKRIKLHEQVARSLSLQIINRELEPLSLLPNEDELARMYEVSRTVIREAIRFLDAKGLVEVRPRIGTRICDPSRWILTDSLLMEWRLESYPSLNLVGDLVELRIMIEPMTAGLAAERASKEQIDVMFRALEDMKNAQTLDEQRDADMRFHLSIIEACGNELMISAIRPVIVSTFRNIFKLYMQDLAEAKRSIPVHEAIILAISEHDSAKASEAMRNSIRYAADDFEKVKQSLKN
jgi:DNA-binding FadR family transcriptional regulator